MASGESHDEYCKGAKGEGREALWVQLIVRDLVLLPRQDAGSAREVDTAKLLAIARR